MNQKKESNWITGLIPGPGVTRDGAIGKDGVIVLSDDKGKMYRSTDGGMNWSYIKDRKLNALRALEFLDNTFYAGTPSEVWSSVDGTNWKHVEIQSGGARAFAYNEQTDTLFAVGHTINRSMDKGKTWEQVFDLKPIYGEAANIMGITCFDDVVVCTGGDMLTLISKDNGATWGQL